MQTLCHLALALALAAVDRGDTAPDFSAKDSAGEPVSLAAMLVRGPVVLAFFPKPFTPGCSQEMAALAKGAGQWRAHGAQVVAISRSSDQEMAKFRADREATFPFVADDGRLIRLYEVGMGPLPMSKRVTFVIGRDGRVAAVLRGSEALEAAPILAALKAAGAAVRSAP